VAVDALTRSLAKELGSRHIRLHSVNPGMVETDRAGRVRVQPERCSFQQVI
jgi:NAD(P)-dependent dehydrogenase (short-subunit alcohol dehydrogenase family)